MAIEVPEDLVSLDQATAHLRLNGVTLDAAAQDDLTMKIAQATAIIINYIDNRPDDADWIEEVEGWTDGTVPPVIQAAILLQLAELHRFRGDEDPPRRDHGFLAPHIVSLLHRYRDPAVS